MNPWIALILGLIAGWLIELLIDVFYWRKRRLCPDDDALTLKSSLEQAQNNNRSLKLSLDENKGRLGQLEADLNARGGEIVGLNGRIHQLEAALAARENELEIVRTELGGIDAEAKELGFGSIFAGGGLALAGFWHNLKDRLAGLKAEAGTLRQQVQGSSVNVDGLNNRIANLETDVAARSTELGDLRTELSDKNEEIGRLYAELDDFNAESEKLGLGSLFAGGGLALSSFFTNLKERFSGEDKMATRNVVFNANLAAKEAEIEGLRFRLGNLEQKLSVCNAGLLEMRTNLGTDYKGAQGLSMIWGLNTTSNDLLANRGIYTYNQLAATQADEVNDAVELSRSYYPELDNAAIHTSWIEQSRLASAGEWDDLFGYQQQRFDMAGLRDDLKKIWGIGPKIEQVLNENGIYLFAQLASVPPDRITEILHRAGSRFQMSTGKLHESWPEQSRLADKGNWDAFQTLHDTLDWSKVQGK